MRAYFDPNVPEFADLAHLHHCGLVKDAGDAFNAKAVRTRLLKESDFESKQHTKKICFWFKPFDLRLGLS